MVASRKLRRKKKNTKKWIETKVTVLISVVQSAGSSPIIKLNCVPQVAFKSTNSLRDGPRNNVPRSAKSRKSMVNIIAK